MKVLLIHNRSAGPGAYSEQDLRHVLTDAGHDVVYRAAKDPKLDWEAALDDESVELIAVAGGDGTVGKVALKAAAYKMPVTILPLGTANNIAAALGISGAPAALAGGWNRGRLKPFDIGVARGPWQEKQFLEAAGIGVFPQLMPFIGALRDSATFSSADEAVSHDLKLFKTLIKDCSAKPWIGRLDGEDASGDFLLVEAMNTKVFGPRLQVAPDADPTDGLLDVVFIGEEHRQMLVAYVEALLNGEVRQPPAFPMRRAAHVEIEWDGSNVHFDSQLWAKGNSVLDAVSTTNHHATSPKIQFQLQRHALEFLVP